jgi:hypothetical protein
VVQSIVSGGEGERARDLVDEEEGDVEHVSVDVCDGEVVSVLVEEFDAGGNVVEEGDLVSTIGFSLASSLPEEVASSAVTALYSSAVISEN